MDSVQRSRIRPEDLKSFQPELFYELIGTDLLVWIKKRTCTNSLLNHEWHGGKRYGMITTSSDTRESVPNKNY